MDFLFVLFFLVFIILSSNASTQSSNRTLGAFAAHECTGPRAYRQTRNAPPSSCSRAIIAGFPIDGSTGVFHHGGEHDYYRLPRTSIWDTCQVTVDLNSDLPRRGTWLEVWTMANTLSTACTYEGSSRPMSALTGGWINAGGMTVTMKRSAHVGNENTTATE